MRYFTLPALVLALMFPTLAQAASFDGASLSPLWAVPFAGILLSIAVMPLATPAFWHHHYGKVSAAWALAFLLPFAALYGPALAGVQLVHAMLAEYIPFIILLTALYTVAGGIHIRGNLHGAPGLNVAILAIGATLASFMGTTGASMLLIRPLVRANDNRMHKAHVVVFFIFIVSNAGGSLTPLGDPPLFLGFLKGVDFFWTAKNILPETLLVVGALLALFYLLDRYYYAKEGVLPVDPTPDTRGISIDGKANFALLVCVVGLVLLCGLLEVAGGVRRVRHAGRPAGTGARCRPDRRRPGLAAHHGRCGAPGQPLRMGADGRGGQAVRRHLPDHHPGDRDAAGRHRGTVRRGGRPP